MSSRRTDLPAPACELGYTFEQVEQITGEHFSDFEEWFAGQTGAICDGQRYNYDIREYEKTGCGPHGCIIYPWDVERFLRGLAPLD